jgi:two-component system NtrC family sensor kinase
MPISVVELPGAPTLRAARTEGFVQTDVVSNGEQWQASTPRRQLSADLADTAMPKSHGATDLPDHLELGEFVRGLAHDIANPLNAMAMNAELTKVLLDRGDAAGARDVLQRLLADCTRCGRLIQSFQRFGGALQASALENVSAATLLQDSITQMQGELPDTGLEFHIDGATDATLTADVPALVRALAGVLRNAAEAGATTVTLQVATPADAIIITITDNGSGIEARWLPRVSEPFFSTRRTHGASGLGLTLAQEILRRHDGTLEIASVQGDGTTVTVRLPRS